MSDKRVSDLDLVRWSEALAGIARTGLAFTDSLYERERFEEVLRVAADIRVAADHDEGRFDAGQVVAGWMASVGEGVAGYVTPKVAVGAIVGNERGSCCSSSGATRGYGCTRPAGPTWATQRPRLSSKRLPRRPGSRSNRFA